MKILPEFRYVICTKHKTEVLVAERLKSIGFDTFTPTKTLNIEWIYRRKNVKVPLLPSMVLISITPKNFNRVFDVSCVIPYLFIDKQKAKVSQEDIDATKYYLSQKYNSKKNFPLLVRK